MFTFFISRKINNLKGSQNGWGQDCIPCFVVSLSLSSIACETSEMLDGYPKAKDWVIDERNI